MKTQQTVITDVPSAYVLENRDYLRTPSVILILVGVLGTARFFIDAPPTVLAMFRFPSIWGSATLVIGGVTLMALSRVMTVLRRRRSNALPCRRSWRSF